MLLSSEEFTQLKCGTAVSPITDFELYGKTFQIFFFCGCVTDVMSSLTQFFFFLSPRSIRIFRTIPRLKDRFQSIYGKVSQSQMPPGCFAKVGSDGVKDHYLEIADDINCGFLLFPSDGKFSTQSRSASAETVLDNSSNCRR